jgi:hypothetical protein
MVYIGNISVSEFVDSCSSWEIDELKELLGVNNNIIDTDKMSLDGLDFINNVNKLSHMYYRLTQEEINTINKIANKY